MQPNHRNILFLLFFLSIGPPFVWGFQNVILSIEQLNQAGVTATLTYITAGIAWFYVSFVTPAISLRRLHRGRISRGKASHWALSMIRWPFRPKFNRALRSVRGKIDAALRLAPGEVVEWSEYEELSKDEKRAIEQIVEEHIAMISTVGFVETSQLLIIVMSFTIATGMMWAARFAALEVLEAGLRRDHEIGKALAEWLTNYILLFAGFLQITTRGTWFGSLHGICAGPLATLCMEERHALVALYVAVAEEEVRGLRRGCYARSFQNGRKWYPPETTSAVLAITGRRFSVMRGEAGWYVSWAEEDEMLVVKRIGVCS